MGIRWTERENDILIRYYEYVNNTDIRDNYLPDRTDSQIRSRAKHLGLSKNIRSTRGWTNEKIALLKELYPNMKTSNIQEQYLSEFTEKQIAEFATKCLRLTKEDNYFVGWTQEEINYLKSNYNNVGLSISDISNNINKSTEQITYVARRLGLCRIGARFKQGKMTKPQLLVYTLLDELNIEYINEFSIDRFSVDIHLLNSNLFIEVMGDFWHFHPFHNYKSFKYKNYVRDKDKRKHDLIKQKTDIEVLYLWESDINHGLDKCKNLILNYIARSGVLNNYHSFNYDLNSNNSIELLPVLHSVGY